MNQVSQQSSVTLLSGNEAIAMAAVDSGVSLAAGYPGTPSTEILENLARYGSVYCEWAPNEKVALEVSLGASFAGGRTLCTMKHVGVNVAADALFTAAYTGVRGGLVLICADDPGMHSSQNEQDNRLYAQHAKVLLLEPADSQEAYLYTRMGFEISERFDIPVMLRTTTRLNHGKGRVERAAAAQDVPQPGALEIDPMKYVMIPAFARMRHKDLEERLNRMASWLATDESGLNRVVSEGDGSVGVITSGVCYHYVCEVLPESWGLLKLGSSFPVPGKLLQHFASRYQRVVVVEELEPFIENALRVLGIECEGKSLFGNLGELDPDLIAQGLGLPVSDHQRLPDKELCMRPPVLCPGCPHRGSFRVLNKLGVYVSGDIGCYTLGVNPPLSGIHACVCMGASLGIAHGMDRVLPREQARKVVAVIGDSTFLHTGINNLINMVYNKSTTTVFILDNRTTAMTGQQENPGYGNTLMGEPTVNVDMEALCRSLGIEHVYKTDPFDTPAMERLARREIERDELSVIIAERECVLAFKDIVKPALHVDADTCIGCRKCLNVGCPALVWHAEERKVSIDQSMCTGCDICIPECPVNAILHPSEQ